MIDKQHTLVGRSGFALIMSLLVVSVVITAGLTILDVSIKQVRLSGNAKDSEIAFSATTAGLECGRYWRRGLTDVMENVSGGAPDNVTGVSCFDIGSTPSTVSPVEVNGVSGGGRAYVYNKEFSWGSGVDARCSKVTTMIIVSDPGAASSIVLSQSGQNNDMREFFPGYPDTVTSKTCPAAGICTVMSARGYNRSCSMINSPGTIEREVLLEY
ncbi:pilus assembly PilX N-terminal domain-containing protein [Patescibacteria group bacterium]|nr:pilus assembly PilX N-terminal domain-containing protein [Patescibacteria group bacterium]